MTILFAVLLVTIVFAVTFLLFNITLRQLLLSLIARDSRYAFYAADSARNCALYWDWNRTNYPSPEGLRPFGYFERDEENNYIFHEADDETDTLSCDGKSDIHVTNSGNTSNPTSDDPYISEFTIFFSAEGSQNSSPCANVKVKQYLESPTRWHANIVSRGYNVSGSLCPPSPPSDRTVERGVTISY